MFRQLLEKILPAGVMLSDFAVLPHKGKLLYQGTLSDDQDITEFAFIAQDHATGFQNWEEQAANTTLQSWERFKNGKGS